MEFNVPKRQKGLNYPLTCSNMVLWWERQKNTLVKKMQGPMAKKYCYNKIIMNFFWGKEDENKRMVELDIFFFFFKTAHFGHTL